MITHRFNNKAEIQMRAGDNRCTICGKKLPLMKTGWCASCQSKVEKGQVNFKSDARITSGYITKRYAKPKVIGKCNYCGSVKTEYDRDIKKECWNCRHKYSDARHSRRINRDGVWRI